MNFNYVIVQAGGKGSRMERLTRNKPKALVPVNNLPMIFHLFKKFPEKKFIIIGDYKAEVFTRYLETFADVEYVFIKSEENGNVAGIREALDFVPESESFFLIWSDLILGEKFTLENLPNGNYIGISKNFPCSWSYFNGVLAKKTIDGHGVAGCFLFENKKFFDDISEAGSFTKWLITKNFDLKELPIADTVEIGTIDAFNKFSKIENRCRPYNKLTFTDDKVVKEALTADAQKLLDFEIEWYEKISALQTFGVPKIYSTNPLTMQKISGNNIFSTNVDDSRKPHVIKKIVDCLIAMHNQETCAPNPFDIEKDYYQKTLKRLRKICAVIPFSENPTIKINGRENKNPLFHLREFNRMTKHAVADSKPFGIIHGDCTFSNTLIDSEENIFFVDARGYFGNTKLVGDPDYDFAKVYYSIVGAFDQFNVKNFELAIHEDSVDFSIAPSGWAEFENYFWSLLPASNKTRIKFIHSIIWLSLASHCWEDYDSMCLAFYNGVELWNEVIDENF